MYQYVRAVLRKRGDNEPWRETDVSLTPVIELFSDYTDGHIELTNAAIGPGSFYVDLNELRSANIKIYNMAFETWLGTLGSTILPTLVSEPVYETRSILYADAWQARYRIQRAYPGDPLDVVGRPRHELRDALLTKDNIDYAELRNNALSVVNGLLHPNFDHPTGLIVKDAGVSLDISGQHRVGLISFVGIGSITEAPITPGMIVRASPTQPVREAMYIETGMDLTNRSVMISIGGYLHLNDSVIRVISRNPGILKIDLSRVDLVRRVFEMRRYIDISPLSLSVSERAKGAVVVDEVLHDGTVLNLMTMVQSFLIVVDTPNLYWETVLTAKAPKLPGRFETPNEPLYPLFSQTGRIIDYWARRQYDRWVLSVDPQDTKRYHYQTVPWQSVQVVNERVSLDGRDPAIGRLRAIRSTVRS